jgi:hypothetical protein
MTTKRQPAQPISASNGDMPAGTSPTNPLKTRDHPSTVGIPHPLSSSPNGNHALAETAAPSRDVAPEVTQKSLQVSPSQDTGTLGKNRYSEFVDDDDDEQDSDSAPLLTKCPARKPNEFDVFRVRASELSPDGTLAEWQIEMGIVEYRGEDPAVPRGFYLIHPRLKRAFGKKARKHLLVTCVNVNGSMFIWPIKITEGFGDSWYRSALIVVANAKEHWVKDFRSDGNGYAADRSLREHGRPKWLGDSLDDLLDLAFDGRIVRDRTHPLCHALEIE